MATIIIVGGGMGGVVTANVLSKTLETNNHRIIMIDSNNTHTFYGSFPLLMINKRNPADLSKKLSRLKHKGIEFLQAKVITINSEISQVSTDKGPINYDYLVLSPGAKHHLETVPGFKEGAFNAYNIDDLNKLRQHLQEFEGGKIVLFISSIPFSCPPAPYEFTFLLEEYLRNRCVRNHTEITLVSPEPGPEPLGGPKIGASIREMLSQRGINYFSEAKVLSLDTSTRQLKLDHGIKIPGDLFIGIPPHWGPDFLRNTYFTEEGGWIKVDPHTLKTPVDNVFAIGDATNIRLPVKKIWAPKTGIFAHYQAEVVARNISKKIHGETPEFRYTGKGM